MRTNATALLAAATTVTALTLLPVPAMAQFAAEAASPASQAGVLMKEVAAAYRKAPTLSDSVTMKGASPTDQRTDTITITFGKDDHTRFTMPGMVMTTMNGSLYLEFEDRPNKYLQTPVVQSIPKTMATLFQIGGGLPFQYEIRFGPKDADHLSTFAMGLIKNPKYDGVADVRDEAGRSLKELAIRGDNGTTVLTIDPESKLVLRQRVDVDSGSSTPGMSPNGMTMDFNPRVAKSLDKPIGFEQGGRKKVGTLRELRDVIGSPAPDFSLQTPDGQTVSLGDLKGNVVVLDFWATWCKYCIKAMPLLQEFHDWAESTDQPVKVFAVNSWERQTTDQVVEFWNGKGWTIPVLIDKANEVIGAYGVGGLPATFVIGPDGNIAKIHRGYSPQMINMLKQDVAGALEGSQ